MKGGKGFAARLQATLCICLLIINFSINTPVHEAVATNNTPGPTSTLEVAAVLCRVINQLTGNFGRAIAALIAISIAIGLLIGKVTWGVAITVAAGMGILFGAKEAINLLSGGNQTVCV